MIRCLCSFTLFFSRRMNVPLASGRPPAYKIGRKLNLYDVNLEQSLYVNNEELP
jgi:hypothetical protein